MYYLRYKTIRVAEKSYEENEGSYDNLDPGFQVKLGCAVHPQISGSWIEIFSISHICLPGEEVEPFETEDELRPRSWHEDENWGEADSMYSEDIDIWKVTGSRMVRDKESTSGDWFLFRNKRHKD